jgi:hypothetical protein
LQLPKALLISEWEEQHLGFPIKRRSVVVPENELSFERITMKRGSSGVGIREVKNYDSRIAQGDLGQSSGELIGTRGSEN